MTNLGENEIPGAGIGNFIIGQFPIGDDDEIGIFVIGQAPVGGDGGIGEFPIGEDPIGR